jgi:NTE family protein
MSLSQLFVPSPLFKSFFSKKKKGASCVALFFQEKIGFIHSGLSTSIWGLLFTVVFVFSFQNSFAQEQKRPKIGLVLSGGGAKGFAHIGVLKVLEEAGVKSIILAALVWEQWLAACTLRDTMQLKLILFFTTLTLTNY